MISAVVLTKNEEKNISECLASLTWCDEVLVIDDTSTDKTVLLAKKLGAKVFSHSLNNDFAAQRNFGMEKAKGDWVLFIDADERVSESLAKEIGTKVQLPSSKVAFFIKRHDVLWGKELKHGESGGVKLLRLATRSAGKWRRQVHETWEVTGRTEVLDNPLLHYPHQTLSEFLHDVDWYSTIHAQVHYKEGKRSSVFKVVFYPKLKFIQNWIVRGGVFDGGPGFVAAMVMSFHSFLSWGKLWLLQKKQPQ